MNPIKLFTIALSTLTPFSCFSQKGDIQLFKTDSSTHIRALAVANDDVLYFGGSKGMWGYTVDGGKSWNMGKTDPEWQKTEFRSIALLPSGELLMANIASPGYILKSSNNGRHWQKVYTNNNEEQFFDAITFSNNQSGWALGDPQNGCVQLLKTTDAGNSWTATDCKLLPVLEKGEAFFASSNTSIDAKGNHVLIATGGPKARVLYSHDNGANWAITSTPIQQGEKMTGIFTLAMYDKNRAVIAGGNYDDKTKTNNTFAYTTNGGKTWQSHSVSASKDETTQLPFVSCIQFVPGGQGKKLLAACSPGIYFSEDMGKSWKKISNESFYTLRISPSGKTAWFAGPKGLIGKLELSKLSLK
ncbi:WD40/YVTN/BNR-like repeat-containing protein [Solitalea lacus]|uniref:WD40/YVTN/BNR-like repeat-containing protein n=1 Tax=Solitalea lacus TaxID=2911172 RepID=UPI001EDBF23A|nr:hypothetical protein [Solitalea lacus]UKJ08006.1 hypothetical protein L2B55_02280 [Solitalea lacus]